MKIEIIKENQSEFELKSWSGQERDGTPKQLKLVCTYPSYYGLEVDDDLSDFSVNNQDKCHYKFFLYTYVFFNQMYVWKEFFKVLPVVVGSDGKIFRTRLIDHYVYLSLAFIFSMFFAKELKINCMDIDFSDTAAIKSVTRGRYVYLLMSFMIGDETIIDFLTNRSNIYNVSLFIGSTFLGLLSMRFSTHTMRRDIRRILDEKNDPSDQVDFVFSPGVNVIHKVLCLSLLLFPLGDIMDFFNVLSQEFVSENNLGNSTVINGTIANDQDPLLSSYLSRNDIDTMMFLSMGSLGVLSSYYFYHAYDNQKKINAIYKIFAFIGDGSRAYGSCSNLCWMVIAALSSFNLVDQDHVFSSENLPYFISFCLSISLLSGIFSAYETEFNQDAAFTENHACIPLRCRS